MESISAFFAKLNTWKYIGLPLTIIVVVLIIYGNVFATSTHPELPGGDFDEAPELLICSDAPDWAKPGTEHTDRMSKFMADHGYAWSNIRVIECGANICSGTSAETEDERLVHCMKGAVVVQLSDPTALKDDTVAQAVRPNNFDQAPWCTILLPENVRVLAMPSDPADQRDLPEHVEALVYTHESFHCRGYGHNLGPTIIPGIARLNSKTGSVMNPSVINGGWVDEGLTKEP